MYIDEYNIKVLGPKWDEKRKKDIDNVEKVNISSTDMIKTREFLTLLEEIKHSHEGCDVQIDVTIKQHVYRD
ncbi:hypothetical protein HTVC309P_gp6 [Pelagibacter phage HTVC309P]|nr:hypothetical protein HTVC309P_gp6 [Pelagibacter phage HTVC309P]